MLGEDPDSIAEIQLSHEPHVSAEIPLRDGRAVERVADVLVSALEPAERETRTTTA